MLDVPEAAQRQRDSGRGFVSSARFHLTIFRIFCAFVDVAKCALCCVFSALAAFFFIPKKADNNEANNLHQRLCSLLFVQLEARGDLRNIHLFYVLFRVALFFVQL